MSNDNCIFCKLANGIIPTNSIYEDEDFNVILDVSPATKGHALVLPKKHYANIYEIDEMVLAKAICVAQKVIKHVTPLLKCDGYNILQNNGEAAGQTIFHFHLHLIPRYAEGNDETLLAAKPGEIEADELVRLKNLMQL